MAEQKQNPVVVLSLEGLKNVLNSSTVIAKLEEYCKQTNKTNRDKLAVQIAVESLAYEVFPQDRIHIHYRPNTKASNKAEVTKLLQSLQGRVELLQTILRACEVKYRDNMFARVVTEGSTEFDRLVRWTATIEGRYEEFLEHLPAGSGITPEVFYTFYAERAYELTPNRRKISITNLAADTIANDIGVKLSQWLRMLTDEHRELTLFMIREVIGRFNGVGEELLTDYKHYDRIRGGLTVLLDAYFPDGVGDKEDSVRAYIKAWVAVQQEAYDQFARTVKNASIEAALGFVGGNTKEANNTALQRMEERLQGHKRERKDKPVRQQKPQQKKASRKLKGEWDKN